MMLTDHTTDALVDHLFRTRAARMVAFLTRLFGPAHVQLAEEVVQEALLEALQRWPFHGVPDNPDGWLMTVARNRALDRVRRDASFQQKADRLTRQLEAWTDPVEPRFAQEVADDRLRLVFLCCHPSLSLDARVALSLKLVAGFGVGEIARAFLVDPPTVAQRLVRARRQLRTVDLTLPAGPELDERLPAVLEVLYLFFNEGYGAHQGADLVRHDLVREAIDLTRLLAASPRTSRPAVHALAALMLFHTARLPARTDAVGDLVLLADQDRSRWDPALVHAAFRHLDRASEGTSITEYHLQAAIAAVHAQAPDAASTDWPAIVALYDQLAAHSPSPVVLLNRAAAIGIAEHPDAGLAAIDEIAGDAGLDGYYLFHAARATLLSRAGRRAEAAGAYRRALTCPCSEPERRFLNRKLSEADSAAR